MAQKRYDKKVITQDETVVMTAPAGYTDTIIGLSVANGSGVDTNITVKVAGNVLLKNTVLSGGSAIVPVGNEQKIVLAENEEITVQADNNVDVMVSVVETQN